MSSYVNGIKPMKRHQSRLAPTVLTLSLLGSLSLLTACGGGGGDDAAPAAPAAGSKPVEVVKPAPTISDFSSPDEPYFVAESMVWFKTPSATKVNTYRLNIIDGRAREALPSGTFESTTPFTNKWTVVQKFKRTLQEFKEKNAKGEDVVVGRQYVEQLLGNGTLVFIREVDGAKKLFEVDLSRGSDLKPIQLSNLADACTVTGSHLIRRDGSEAAVYVTTAGNDGKCDTTADNLVRIVKTGAQTAEERAMHYTPVVAPEAVIRHLYKDGVLTGALVQQGSGETTQLAVLSPTLHAVLNTSAIKIGNVTEFETSKDDSKLGVEWIADAPGEVGGGYLRLQQFDIKSNDYTNALYRFDWNAASKAATTSSEPMVSLTSGAATNKGVNDHRYVYFVDGDLVFRGPTGSTEEPFEAISFLSELTGKALTTKAYVSDQTSDQIVVRAQGDLDAAFAVPKNPDSSTLSTVTLFNNTLTRLSPQTPLGIWHQVVKTSTGEVQVAYMITKQRSEFDLNGGDPNGYSLKRIPLALGTGFDEFLNEVNRINVLGAVWSPMSVNGQRDLMSAITCPRTSIGALTPNGTCNGNGDEMKTVDFEKKSFGVTLGKLVTTNGQNAIVSAGDFYHGINGLVSVTRDARTGLEKSQDPWFLNTQLAGSLKSVSTPYKPK